MKGAVLFAPHDVRFIERADPKIEEPTPMGHEYCGIVEEVGSAVATIERGQFVVGSFWASDNTCPICQAGYQSRCVDARPMGALGAQAPYLRVPLADGTLVAAPEIPSDDLVPSLLSASDVSGTGWFGADAAAASVAQSRSCFVRDVRHRAMKIRLEIGVMYAVAVR